MLVGGSLTATRIISQNSSTWYAMAANEVRAWTCGRATTVKPALLSMEWKGGFQQDFFSKINEARQSGLTYMVHGTERTQWH